MKKITLNAPLNHKAYSYVPMQIEVEKVIPLYGRRFEQMREHPLEDVPEIIDNRDLPIMNDISRSSVVQAGYCFISRPETTSRFTTILTAIW